MSFRPVAPSSSSSAAAAAAAAPSASASASASAAAAAAAKPPVHPARRAAYDSLITRIKEGTGGLFSSKGGKAMDFSGVEAIVLDESLKNWGKQQADQKERSDAAFRKSTEKAQAWVNADSSLSAAQIQMKPASDDFVQKKRDYMEKRSMVAALEAALNSEKQKLKANMAAMGSKNLTPAAAQVNQSLKQHITTQIMSYAAQLEKAKKKPMMLKRHMTHLKQPITRVSSR